MPIFAVVFVSERRTKTGSVAGNVCPTATSDAAPLTVIFAIVGAAAGCLGALGAGFTAGVAGFAGVGDVAFSVVGQAGASPEVESVTQVVAPTCWTNGSLLVNLSNETSWPLPGRAVGSESASVVVAGAETGVPVAGAATGAARPGP